jgi:cyclopropane-fatty-acyl-phospholipid synthase
VEKSLRAVGERTAVPFAVRFADGTGLRTRDAAPAFTIVFRRPRAYWRIAAYGHVGFLEAYFDDDIDLEGSLAKALAAGMEGGFDAGAKPLAWIRNRWHELTHSNAARAQARANAEAHYALPPEFYKFWLDDPLMLYTCAYWKEGTRSVEEAQRNKIDHVCRKIRLKDGDSVVDIGCGFGGFMFRALENYDVRVCGVNTTTEQVEWLHDQIASRGLQHRLEAREADFREVHTQFDKVVSIGVLEHAGRDQLRAVVKAHADFLKPGGLGMLHFIGHVGVRDTEFYIRKHVFPGGWIPSLAETISAMEECGLEIVDIENLRRHYAFTLDAWCERFERNWERIRAIDPRRFDERFRRVWRTYLYSCAEMFRSPHTRTHLFQVLFSKGNTSSSSYPMSRAFLYAEDFAGREVPAPAREPATTA